VNALDRARTATLRFGEHELDFTRREVRRGSETVPLQETPLRVLLHLAAHRDRTVGRRELLDVVWPGVTVGEESLTTALALARRAVDDDGKSQRVIRTQHRVGYRFVALARELPVAAHPRWVASPPPSSPGTRFAAALEAAAEALRAAARVVHEQNEQAGQAAAAERRDR
jgi:DNA-binding winged helix-turn-helix (wHTH) protein